MPPEAEQKLVRRAVTLGRTPPEYAAQVLIATLSGIDASSPLPTAGELTPEQRLAAWNEWMAEIDSRPPITHFVDCTRDSIYDGPDERGER